MNKDVRNQVVAGMILSLATGIASVVSATVRSFFVFSLHFYWEKVCSFWHHLGNTVPVYWWIVYLVSILSLLVIGVFLYLCFRSFVLSNDWEKRYRSDTFEGVLWRWDYLYREILSPTPYCPKCKMQLLINDCFGYEYTRGNKRLKCEHCGFLSMPFTVGFNELQNKVERLIARKINTGEWKQSQNSQS